MVVAGPDDSFRVEAQLFILLPYSSTPAMQLDAGLSRVLRHMLADRAAGYRSGTPASAATLPDETFRPQQSCADAPGRTDDECAGWLR